MKRAFAVSLLLVVLVASSVLVSIANADITRAGIIPEGHTFPRVADLDGNGIDDLIHETFVLLGQGSGQFVKRALPLGEGIYAIEWLDVNGDGRVDLLSRTWGGGLIRGIPGYQLHIATGAQLEFAPGIEITPVGGDSEPMIGDLNDDGKDDLLLVKILFKNNRDYAAQLTVHLSRGDGTFEKREPFLIPTHPQWGRYGRRLLMGDVTRDGRRDVVIRSTYDLVVLTSTGGGDFTVRSGFLPMDFGHWENDLGDIDGDGNLDVVAAAARTVRVYFGDGRGGFNRTTKLSLPRQTFPTLLPIFEYAIADNTAAPRSLHVGEFVTKGRAEILGTVAEGDIFVVAYENGRLREVAPRIATEFIQGDVFVGSFRKKGSRDFLVTYNLIHGEGNPKPGLFNVEPTAAAVTAAPARSGRGRAVAQPTLGDMKVSIDAKDCVYDADIKTLERAGIFGSFRHGNESMDTVLDEDGLLWFRYFPKWEPYGLWGTLTPKAGGGWEGTARAMTPCGQQDVRIVVER